MLMHVSSLLQSASQRLRACVELPKLEASMLLSHAAGKSREFLIAHPDAECAEEQVILFERLLEKRLNGEPIAYLLGVRDFWDISLHVTPDVLIPRPETELLVETALALLGELSACRVLDLGTGSGAIALALANARPAWHVSAVDYSEKALAVASANRQRLGLENVNFYQGSWFEPLPTIQFDLIISNPPYIAKADAHLENGDVRFEPRLALTSGVDGLDAIRHIIANAVAYLNEGGILLLEHGYDQSPSVLALLEKAGFSERTVYHDLAGHARAAGAALLR